jgi:Flp pilus assembly protein TadB
MYISLFAGLSVLFLMIAIKTKTSHSVFENGKTLYELVNNNETLKKFFHGETDAEKLIKAGLDISPEDFAFYRFILTGAALLSLIIFIFTFNFLFLLPCPLIVAPDIYLSSKIKSRKKKMRKEFMSIASKLVVAVSGGLSFYEALDWASKDNAYTKTELGKELRRTVEKAKMGLDFGDVMKEFSLRTGVVDIQRLSIAIIQAHKYGTSISEILTKEVTDCRERYKSEIIGQAINSEKKTDASLIILAIPTMIMTVAPMAITFMQMGGLGALGQ